MKASEIMTRGVIAVSPETPVRDVAKLMVEQRISGVPVVDDGRLIGILSENDLMRRVELGTEKTRPRWVQFLTADDTLLAEYVHARGRLARDVMTTNVITVAPDDPVASIAEILETHHIKRVPVVDGGKVVGIVSRANLLQALATIEPVQVTSAQTDLAIRDAVAAEIQQIALLPSPVMNNVTVSDGTVHLWGYVGSENGRRAVRIAAERVAGVKEVKDHRRGLLSS
jgi:CBS domain-containing protein